MTEQELSGEMYAEQLAIQLRKGFLAYCVLKVCSSDPMYTSDIIRRLSEAELVVVEGTIYPLLSRLQKDGLLTHEWQESEQGPPRKYYKITDYGNEVMEHVTKKIATLNTTLKKL
jgi:PadR family transcriptional regulator PadR